VERVRERTLALLIYGENNLRLNKEKITMMVAIAVARTNQTEGIFGDLNFVKRL